MVLRHGTGFETNRAASVGRSFSPVSRMRFDVRLWRPSLCGCGTDGSLGSNLDVRVLAPGDRAARAANRKLKLPRHAVHSFTCLLLKGKALVNKLISGQLLFGCNCRW